MDVKYKYMGVTIDAEFKDHICFLSGDSGLVSLFCLGYLNPIYQGRIYLIAYSTIVPWLL